MTPCTDSVGEINRLIQLCQKKLNQLPSVMNLNLAVVSLQIKSSLFLISADLNQGAKALRLSLELSPSSLPELVPFLAVGLVLAQRELVMALWREDANG